MTGTALHTNKILEQCMQYLVSNKILIAFTTKKNNIVTCKFVLISTWIFVMNKRICDVLLNYFVFSIYQVCI